MSFSPKVEKSVALQGPKDRISTSQGREERYTVIRKRHVTPRLSKLTVNHWIHSHHKRANVTTHKIAVSSGFSAGN